MNKIIVYGLASQRIVAQLELGMDLSESLMDFLMRNKITIASSCGGAGSCKKCVVNKDLLSCQVSLRDFLGDNQTAVVEVTYL